MSGIRFRHYIVIVFLVTGVIAAAGMVAHLIGKYGMLFAILVAVIALGVIRGGQKVKYEF